MEPVENRFDLDFTVCRDCEAVMFYGGNVLKDMLDVVNSYSSLWLNDILSISYLHGGNKIMSHSFMLS